MNKTPSKNFENIEISAHQRDSREFIRSPNSTNKNFFKKNNTFKNFNFSDPSISTEIKDIIVRNFQYYPKNEKSENFNTNENNNLDILEHTKNIITKTNFLKTKQINNFGDTNKNEGKLKDEYINELHDYYNNQANFNYDNKNFNFRIKENNGDKSKSLPAYLIYKDNKYNFEENSCSIVDNLPTENNQNINNESNLNIKSEINPQNFGYNFSKPNQEDLKDNRSNKKYENNFVENCYKNHTFFPNEENLHEEKNYNKINSETNELGYMQTFRETKNSNLYSLDYCKNAFISSDNYIYMNPNYEYNPDHEKKVFPTYSKSNPEILKEIENLNYNLQNNEFLSKIIQREEEIKVLNSEILRLNKTINLRSSGGLVDFFNGGIWISIGDVVANSVIK